MAKQCSHCGQDLPGDDAQFCNRCGMLVSGQPLPSESLSDPSAPPTLPEKPALREQIAQQPGDRRPSLPPEHPAWMNSLGRDRFSSLSGSSLSPSSPDPEIPLPPSPIQPSLSGLEPLFPPARELRIKVWEQDGSETPLPPEKFSSYLTQKAPLTPSPLPDAALPSASALPLSSPDSAGSSSEIEDLPTRALPSAPRSDPGRTSLEQFPTRSMSLTPSQRDVLSDKPASPPPATSNIDEIVRVDTVMMPARPTHTPSAQPSFPGLSSSPTPVSPPVHRAKSRKPLLFATLLLLVILLAAGGTWVYLARPFSISDVTRPWQSFHDSSLGLSLQYPTGWSSDNHSTHSVSLHDSSNTAIVTVSTLNANGNDPTHVLQQQASTLGMTGVKSLPSIVLAGVTWQSEQGSVQINGATYTITLLAGTRGPTLYTLGQLAAQNVYTEYEQAVFAPMRSSLRFL